MRVIRLTHGAGNGVDKACLMTASNMLIGRGADGDNNSCVCQVLRGFIVRTNDRMPESLLGELYGPLAWEILGTRNDDRTVMLQRADMLFRWTRDLLNENWAGSPYWATKSLDYAAGCYAEADQATCKVVAMLALHTCSTTLGLVAGDLAECSYASRIKNIWPLFPEIIRRVASIGDKRPVECVIDCEQLADALA